MVITTTMLMDELTHYSDPAGKILRMKKKRSAVPNYQRTNMKHKKMYQGIVLPV